MVPNLLHRELVTTT